MARVGLTLWLVFAIAAGPWLCCCTAAHLAAARDPTVPAPAPPCCCDHQTSADGEQASESHRKPERHCPCQEDRPTAAVVAALRPAAPTQDHTHAHCWSLSLPVMLPTVVETGLPVEDSAARVLFPGRDLLSLLHILRC